MGDKEALLLKVGALRKQAMLLMTELTDAGSLRIPTRCSLAPQHEDGVDFIAKQFTDLGFTDVQKQPFSFTYHDKQVHTWNVIATLLGSSRPEEEVIVGAHHDSTADGIVLRPSAECRVTPAPGAIDNAAGCAAVIILAQAMRAQRFNRTLRFICFGGEEQNLEGARYYVSTIGPARSIAGALIMDMISFSQQFYGVSIEGTTDPVIEALSHLVAHNAMHFAPKLNVSELDFSWGSDHVPFQDGGIPAVLLIQADDTDYPCYHEPCDTLHWANMDLQMDITTAVAGAAWDLAQADSPPSPCACAACVCL